MFRLESSVKKMQWGWSLLSHFLWFVHLCLITLPLPQYPPGESYLLHYWFVKQLKRLSPKGILVSPCVRNSMLQCCTTPRKGPGRRGDLAVLQSQKSNVHIALSPHDSPLSWFTIQTIIFCGVDDEKLSQMSLTPGRSASWLVGPHRSSCAAPKDAVTRADV